MKMILFFHFICLIARYIVLNISKTFVKPKVPLDEHISDDTSCVSSNENWSKKKLEYSRYPIYESGTLKFFPPVYIQRYETVAFVLQDFDSGGEIRKVVDFGCADLGFFNYLKNVESVTEILEVDIDSEILEKYSYKAAPVTADYLMGKREKPLDVYILVGNVADYDDYLLNCDAVVAIELIEHLAEDDLRNVPYNVFCKIKPKIAIFTTPNADFNSLLPNLMGKRHKDHKFEWTRKEFFNWTQQILSDYPHYNVRFYGIGAGPEGTENLGCCTQMAVFQKLGDSEPYLTSREKFESVQNYKLIKHYEFPAHVDHRTNEEKIIHEIQYRAGYLKGIDSYYNFDTNKSEIPFSLLKQYVSDFQYDDEEIMKILSDKGMTLIEKNNNWFLVFSDTDSVSSDCNISFENSLNDTPVNESCDQSFEERWSDEEPACLKKLAESETGKQLKFSQKFSANDSDLKLFHKENHECVLTKSGVVPDDCNHSPNSDDSLGESPDDENCRIKKSSLFKSIMSDKETEFMHKRRNSIFHVCKPFEKTSKSGSLDSLLQNFNLKHSKQDSVSKSFDRLSQLSSYKSKQWINCSEGSLLNNSFDKAVNSGCPFSLISGASTPEVDDSFTEIDITSTSLSSICTGNSSP